MTTSKSILAICVALATTYSATSMAVDYDIYGKAEVQIASTDKGVLKYTKEGTQIDAPFSRLGVKGTHKLQNNMSVVFKYEVQVRGFEHDETKSPYSARNTYVGLKGNWGTVLVGRNDTRFKYSEGKVDQFNETQSDITQLLPGQDRLGDTVTYSSKKFNDMSVSFTYAPKDDASNNESGFAATAIYGDRSLKSKPYYIAVSHTDGLNDLVASRVVLAYKNDGLQLGAIVQKSENLAGDVSGNGFLVSASYRIEQWQPKIQFAKDNSQLRHKEDATQWTIGTDYILDKQTNLYAMFTQLDLDTTDDSSFAVGLKYKF